MKKLLLLSAFLTFACTDDDTSNEENTNPSNEKLIESVTFHSVQDCGESNKLYDVVDFVLSYTNNRITSFSQRKFDIECENNNLVFEESWSGEFSLEYNTSGLIINSTNSVSECLLNDDGFITSIPQDESVGSLGYEFIYTDGYLSYCSINEYPNQDDTEFIFSWLEGNRTVTRLNPSQPSNNMITTYQYGNLDNKLNLFSSDFMGESSRVFEPIFNSFLGKSSLKLPEIITKEFYSFSALTLKKSYQFDYVIDDNGYVRYITIFLDESSFSPIDNTEYNSSKKWTLEFTYTN